VELSRSYKRRAKALLGLDSLGAQTNAISSEKPQDRQGEDARVDTSKYAKSRRAAEPTADRDVVEDALARALVGASEAGRWDVVARLARKLEARRLAGSNVVPLDALKGSSRG